MRGTCGRAPNAFRQMPAKTVWEERMKRMKMIKAVVRPEKVSAVLEELAQKGYNAVTRISILGRGKQRGLKVGDAYYDEIPKELLCLVVEDGSAEEVVSILLKTAKSGQTGAYGDGKIFISHVERAFTISSGKEEL